ncbi:MAG TPA: alpha/beta hydrolase [Aestuariivirgaceae bacterium]|nr:alpha/beta hydrolase [Aestuariivirgaceae bacterium]
MAVLEVAGAQLEYRSLPGREPGLALLHEGLGCVSMWRDFPDRLNATSGNAVFVWSRRGYGGSSPAPAPWPVGYMHEEARDWLPQVLAAAGFKTFVLIGHSDGASIAAIYAGEQPAPGLRGLVLMAPHFFVEDVSIASIAQAREAYECGDLRSRLERHHEANVDGAFWGWNGAWLDPDFRDWDIQAMLPDIRVPTLLIQGADDEYGTLAQINAAQSAIPSPVTTLVLPGSRHSPHRDRPDATLEAITAFLSAL